MESCARQEQDAGDKEDLVNWEFVAKELITITTIYNLGDKVGRGNLVLLLKELLCISKTPVSFVPVLVEVFSKVESNVQQRIDQVLFLKFDYLKVSVSQGCRDNM